MSNYRKLPPCDGDYFNCKRRVRNCHGKQADRHTPYTKGTRPLDRSGNGDFGAVKVITNGCDRR